MAAKETPAPVSRPDHEKKAKGYLLPLLPAAVYGIAAAVLLILNHSEILKFVSDTFPVLAEGGFILGTILPAVILFFAWCVSFMIVCLLSKVILDHKPVWVTLIVAGIIAGGLYGYDQLNPGFIDSAISQVKQIVYVVSQSEAAETEQTAEASPVQPQTAMEAVPAAETSSPAAYRMTKEKGTMLRAETSINAGIVARIKRDEIVYALDEIEIQAGRQSWRRVSTQSGKTGWIMCRFLEPIDD